MGVLKIHCYCDEVQMDAIVRHIADYLYSTDRYSLSDVDEEIEGMRVCVDFEVFMDTIRLQLAEVQDADWDTLYEDSAVLTSRLRKMLADYNSDRRESIRQAREIRRDQLSALGINNSKILN